MGRDWVVSGLTKLRSQIDEGFGDQTAAIADPSRLASRAHALIAHASLFGFAELSQLCSKLEQACKAEELLPKAFQEAKAAALIADETCRSLLLGSLSSEQENPDFSRKHTGEPWQM